jgi:hypothetical protein
VGSGLCTHKVFIPTETLADISDLVAVETVTEWFRRRVIAVEAASHAQKDFLRGGFLHCTSDPLCAAVMTAVSEGGWRAGSRAIDLIEAGANHTEEVP